MTVTLTTSASGGIAPAAVAITLTATIAGDTATKVDFYNGSTQIGEVTAAPFILSWTPPVGTTNLYAVATNASAQTTTSATVQIQFVAALGLSFGASAGVIGAPFMINGDGTISQPLSASSPVGSDSGSAIYLFQVAGATDDYELSAVVNCADAASNSFYVGFDLEPDATMLWEVTPTSGNQVRIVTDSSALPRIWTLTAGYHWLYIRGADGNARLASITVAKLPAKSVTVSVAGNVGTTYAGNASVNRISTPAGDYTAELAAAEATYSAESSAASALLATTTSAALTALDVVVSQAEDGNITQQYIADERYLRTLSQSDEVQAEALALSEEKRDRIEADAAETRDRKTDDIVLQNFIGLSFPPTLGNTQYDATRYPATSSTTDLDAPIANGNSLELAVGRLGRQLQTFQVDTTTFTNSQHPNTALPLIAAGGVVIAQNPGDQFYDTAYGTAAEIYYWPTSLPAPTAIRANVNAALYLKGIGLSGGNLLYAGVNTFFLTISGVFDVEATVWYRVLDAPPPVNSSPTYPWRFAMGASTILGKATTVLPSPAPLRYYAYSHILSVSVGANQYLQFGVNSINGGSGTRASAAHDKTGKLYGGILNVLGLNVPVLSAAH